MQGFVSIAEVDNKGRARRLPIKADIRKALCFPGGSTLMVSHLNKDLADNSAGSLRLCILLKPHEKSSSSAVIGVQQLGISRDGCCSPIKPYRMISGAKNIPPEVLVNDGLSQKDDKLDGT